MSETTEIKKTGNLIDRVLRVKDGLMGYVDACKGVADAASGSIKNIKAGYDQLKSLGDNIYSQEKSKYKDIVSQIKNIHAPVADVPSMADMYTSFADNITAAIPQTGKAWKSLTGSVVEDGKGLWGAVKDTGTGLWKFITGANFRIFSKEGLAGWAENFDRAKDKVGGGLENASVYFGNLTENFGNFTAGVKRITDTVMTGYKNTRAFMLQTIDAYKKATGAGSKTNISLGLASQTTELLGRINVLGEVAAERTKEIIDKTQKFLGDDWGVTTLKNFWDEWKPRFKDVDYYEKIFGEANVAAARNAFSDGKQAVKEGMKVMNQGVDVFKTAFGKGSLKDKISSIPDMIKGITSGTSSIKDLIKGKDGEAGIKDNVKTVIAGGKEIVGKVPDMVKAAPEKMLDTFGLGFLVRNRKKKKGGATDLDESTLATEMPEAIEEAIDIPAPGEILDRAEQEYRDSDTGRGLNMEKICENMQFNIQNTGEAGMDEIADMLVKTISETIENYEE